MALDFRLYFQDMANSIDKVLRYTDNADYERFTTDEMMSDAVIRNLWVIAEAANDLTPEIRARYPGINWEDINAFRNVVAHSNFGIDLELVWDIVKNRLHPLSRTLSVILKE